jgi:catechol 2,3-dioxygenase-like lactoylglutathione lyase family enzyme
MIQLDEISVPTPGPTDQPWGNRSMRFRDPDGNLINFYALINGDKL